MTQQPEFIGRAEPEVKMILSRLFPKGIIKTQVPITKLIYPEDVVFMDEEFRNHKCDMTLETPDQYLVVEVNYKHKEKAASKWRRTFAPDLIRNGKIPVTIDNYDCTDKGLFYLNSKKEHELSWDDFRDVINQLEKAGVKA